MITKEMTASAKANITEYWGPESKKIISLCKKAKPVNLPITEFTRRHCVACGGDWGAMLLSGIRKLYPEVWDAIPNDMGVFAWQCIVSVLILLGVDSSE